MNKWIKVRPISCQVKSSWCIKRLVNLINFFKNLMLTQKILYSSLKIYKRKKEVLKGRRKQRHKKPNFILFGKIAVCNKKIFLSSPCTQKKLKNVQKTLRRHPGCLLDVSHTLKLRLVSTGLFLQKMMWNDNQPSSYLQIIYQKTSPALHSWPFIDDSFPKKFNFI